MRFGSAYIGAALLLAACQALPTQAQETQTLAEARRGQVTKLVEKTQAGEDVAKPPKGVLVTVQFASPAGSLAAYITPAPKDGGKHPAIIWITGGDSNTIGDVWNDRDPSNDQTASAFRKAGIVTMYPSLRGGNRNPGYREGMYGEVDDILAAADYLAKQPGVDPARIYLGGHSTGGTLVMLVAEMDPRFRATFAFGPVASPEQYGGEFLYGLTDKAEIKLRAPAYWLESVRSPLFVIEGADQGNADMVELMQSLTKNRNIHFGIAPRATHFSILAPATALIAQRILADTGPAANISLTQADLDGLIR